MSTGCIYSSRYPDHETGPGFPESPERILAVYQKLGTGLLRRLATLDPQPREPGLAELVHDREYVQRIREASLRGDLLVDTSDNPIGLHSYTVAQLALAGVAAGVDSIMEGGWTNGMVILRPPGHHAERDRAMGFCLFNNVAVAARYLQHTYDLNRIMIIDIDVHHGNGTQHIFEEDPSVYYLSLHQFPFYPGTGGKAECGVGKGKGFTLNFPLPGGSDDQVYLHLMETKVAEAVLEYCPEFLLVSAGFDAHEKDPIGGMNVSSSGFQHLTRILVDLSKECCAGRLLSVLEGGYHLDSLAESVELHLTELLKV